MCSRIFWSHLVLYIQGLLYSHYYLIQPHMFNTYIFFLYKLQVQDLNFQTLFNILIELAFYCKVQLIGCILKCHDAPFTEYFIGLGSFFGSALACRAQVCGFNSRPEDATNVEHCSLQGMLSHGHHVSMFCRLLKNSRASKVMRSPTLQCCT